MENLIFVEVKVICHTNDCENNDIEIPMTIIKNSVVICGPCMNNIEDVIEVG